MFVIILSAPKNIIQREITRQTLNAVAKTDLKWAFIIGQTMPDIQVATYLLKSWGSTVTPSATLSFKRSYKISKLHDYKNHRILCIALQHCQKMGMILENKVIQKLNYYQLKKRTRKTRIIFDTENSLWKSDFGTFWWGCKAMQRIQCFF